MTLCNNLSRKRGVGVFSRVDVFSRDYGTITELVDSVCRDTTYTQYVLLQKKSHQISETAHL